VPDSPLVLPQPRDCSPGSPSLSARPGNRRRIHGAAARPPSSRSRPAHCRLWSDAIAAHFRSVPGLAVLSPARGVRQSLSTDRVAFRRRPLQTTVLIPNCTGPARWAERPGAPGVFERRTDGFDFCRFCRFRVLTQKWVSHITRLAATTALRPEASDFQDKAGVLPGNRKNLFVPKR